MLNSQGFKIILKYLGFCFAVFNLKFYFFDALWIIDTEWFYKNRNEQNSLFSNRVLSQNKILLWIMKGLFQHFLSFLLDVLRYGLPVNFQAMLLQPNKKTMKKLREVLYDLYKHLDSSAAAIIDVSTF